MTRLSHSALEKYIGCPAQYKLHYIDRIRSHKLGSALIFGSSLDEALNRLLQTKMDVVPDGATDDLEALKHGFDNYFGFQKINKEIEDVKTSHFIELIAVTAGDPEAKQRAATVEHTARKQEAGDSTTGLPSLAEILEPKVVNKLREWLDIKREVSPKAAEKEIEELNAQHAVIRIGGKTAILNEDTDPVLGRREISFSSPTDFRAYTSGH